MGFEVVLSGWQIPISLVSELCSSVLQLNLGKEGLVGLSTTFRNIGAPFWT